MNKKYEDFSRRVYILIVVMGLWGAAIGLRLYLLQVVHSSEYREMAAKQQQRTLELTPRRGVIYDRNGNELAVSIKVDSVFAVPSEIKDPARTAKTLSALTGLSSSELQQRLESGKSFAWIRRKMSAAEADAIRQAQLRGIYFQKEDRRFYPKRELAAHVLGYVNVDEEGMGGLEYRYNDRVRGDSGKVVVMTDARGHSYYRMEQAPAPGANLVTTIDENIQYIIEKELQAAVIRTRAKGISIVAMDPRSGEILGMGNYPTFNPNEYAKYAPASWTNGAVSNTYEPGSTFKITTAAAALEENLTTPDEVIDCQMGSIVLYGHVIHDAHKLGLLTVKQIIQLSSNVGAIKLGLRLGDERLASYIDRLGFGHPTNIDLPGEERGLTKPASQWSKISIGAISMGQEIGVTPLQTISLVAAVANGGILYRPYVVKKIQDPKRGVTDETEPHGERVLSERTARELQEMLEVVVTDGTAKDSKLDGYRAAGKTGTAQKVDPRTGRYGVGKYVSSFAGYAPASNPMLALIVVVDEPVGAYYAAAVAAPIFKSIAEQVLRYRSIAPDVPEYAPHYTATPKTRRPASPKNPEQAEWQTVDAAFTSSTEPAGAPIGSVIVPDFYGNSLRQVTEETIRLGLKMRSTGSGRAAAQSPPSGARVPAGTPVQVRFSTRP